MVDSSGQFRYSCLCGKELKNKTTFKRHTKKCQEYKKEAVESGYCIKCKICGEAHKQTCIHLKYNHKDISLEEYQRQYPDAEIYSEYFKEMSAKRGKKNGSWIKRAQESGEDLSEYWKKVSKGVSSAILENPKERVRRANLMKELWQDKEFAKKTKKVASKTAKKTSARPEILKARVAQLKKWRDENPEEFYEKCTKIMHSKWSSTPEKILRDFCQNIIPSLKWNQQILAKKYFTMNKTGRKQVDLIDKKRKIIIELDGPHHFEPIYGEEILLLNKQKDLALNKYCNDSNYLLIRISHSEFKYSSKKFNQETLNKIEKILESNQPGIYKIGKEYV